MPDYKNSKIYKITAGNLTYYGSTTQSLSKRLAKHRNDKKHKPNSNISSFPLLDMPDCKIVLVEDYPCERKEQLLAREAYYTEHNDCVNKRRPICTEEQQKQAKREERRRYYTKYPEKKREEKYRYYTKYPDKCPNKLKKYYGITNLEPSTTDLEPSTTNLAAEQHLAPNPEPVRSASSRYRERQQRLKLILQSKITFENILR